MFSDNYWFVTPDIIWLQTPDANMVKLVEKIKLPSVGPDGNPISYKFIQKVTGRQLLETQTLAEAGIKDGDVLRLQPEITAG